MSKCNKNGPTKRKQTLQLFRPADCNCYPTTRNANTHIPRTKHQGRWRWSFIWGEWQISGAGDLFWMCDGKMTVYVLAWLVKLLVNYPPGMGSEQRVLSVGSCGPISALISRPLYCFDTASVPVPVSVSSSFSLSSSYRYPRYWTSFSLFSAAFHCFSLSWFSVWAPISGHSRANPTRVLLEPRLLLPIYALTFAYSYGSHITPIRVRPAIITDDNNYDDVPGILDSFNWSWEVVFYFEGL